jgi:hypothetical protein
LVNAMSIARAVIHIHTYIYFGSAVNPHF